MSNGAPSNFSESASLWSLSVDHYLPARFRQKLALLLQDQGIAPPPYLQIPSSHPEPSPLLPCWFHAEFYNSLTKLFHGLNQKSILYLISAYPSNGLLQKILAHKGHKKLPGRLLWENATRLNNRYTWEIKRSLLEQGPLVHPWLAHYFASELITMLYENIKHHPVQSIYLGPYLSQIDFTITEQHSLVLQVKAYPRPVAMSLAIGLLCNKGLNKAFFADLHTYLQTYPGLFLTIGGNETLTIHVPYRLRNHLPRVWRNDNIAATLSPQQLFYILEKRNLVFSDNLQAATLKFTFEKKSYRWPDFQRAIISGDTFTQFLTSKNLQFVSLIQSPQGESSLARLWELFVEELNEKALCDWRNSILVAPSPQATHIQAKSPPGRDPKRTLKASPSLPAPTIK